MVMVLVHVSATVVVMDTADVADTADIVDADMGIVAPSEATDILGINSYLDVLVSDAWFKDSAESETSRPSRIRLSPLRDESESRVGRLNSEETDSAENRS